MIQIVIAQRGWVFVGNVTATSDEIIIEDAKNIRKWGTTRGLGQIAQDGPTTETRMDDYGTVIIHPLAVIARIKCTVDKWK